MDDTTITQDKLDNLVQAWFDEYYQDNGRDGLIDLDAMVEGIEAELHPAVKQQILNFAGESSISSFLTSYIYAGDTI